LPDTDAAAPVRDLLARLDLVRHDTTVFEADPGGGRGRLFGGLVAAQALMAAGRTVETGQLHSLHAYFLRPGRYDAAILLEVDRIRDGRSFTTRRVVASQAGEEIFCLSASFAVPEAGMRHQEPMPAAPPGDPTSFPTWEQMRRRQGPRPGQESRNPLEVHVAAQSLPPEDSAERVVWMRFRAPLPDDPLLRAAALVYASDRTLVGTARLVAHHQLEGDLMGASLDHSLWLHHLPPLEGWLLYRSRCPVAEAARGLILGELYDEAGVRLASVAQEGLIRARRPV